MSMVVPVQPRPVDYKPLAQLIHIIGHTCRCMHVHAPDHIDLSEPSLTPCTRYAWLDIRVHVHTSTSRSLSTCTCTCPDWTVQYTCTHVQGVLYMYMCKRVCV